MTQSTTKLESLYSLLGIFALLLMTVFATEVAIMDLLAEVWPRDNSLFKGILDAFLLTLAFSLPLWFFVLRPVTSGRQKRPTEGASQPPVRLFLLALAGIFLTQLLIMQVVLPRYAWWWSQEALLDATASLLLSAPILLWLLYELGLHRLREPLIDFLHTPVTLFFLLLLLILMADLMQEIIAPVVVPGAYGIAYKAIDSAISTLVIAPLLWMLVARPLLRVASSQQARIKAIYDQVIDAILLVNEQGRVQSLNLAAQDIFGYSEKEAQGQSAILFSREKRIAWQG